jgi:glycosyltransferase involved in cell wall biosynthesis
MSALRILHAPLDIGGHAHQLSLAERELGIDSQVAVFSSQSYGYGTDLDLRAGVDVPVPVRIARRAAFLRKALDRFDVFHFNYGQSLLQVRQLGRVVDELPLLRRRGKTILVTYQGCDVRPFAECFCRRRSCAATSIYRAPAAARFLRYAHRVYYLNPDHARQLPGATFLPYASVDPRELEPTPPSAHAGGELVVGHAPTDRNVKGTRHVEQAIELLRAEGVPIRLDLIERTTRADALARTAAADVVVDQLLIGWYGGYAVEAMAMAKPVVCFIREEENPFGQRLPVVRATPATLADRLRELAEDRPRLRETGLAGRTFAEAEHDPRRVARTVLDGIAEIRRDAAPAR